MKYLFCVVPFALCLFAWACAFELLTRAVLRRVGLLSLLLCFSLNAADRTRVERIPVGTSGAITSINVKAYFYTYDAGTVTAKYLMEWVETTAGVLSGARTVKAATPGGSYGSAVTITSTYVSSWIPQFTASWNVEAPTGWKFADHSPSPLTGAAWFTAPNDTLTYIQDTWRSIAEGGGSDDPGYNPPVASTYVPYQQISGTSAAFIYNDAAIAWVSSSQSQEISHCRGVKAFARHSLIGTAHYVRLVWDENISSEHAVRYFPLFTWNTTSLPTSALQVGQLYYAQISYTGGTATSVLNYGGLYAGNTPGGTSSETHFPGQQSVVARFIQAYNRDHGSGGAGAAAAVFGSSSTLEYFPDSPPGIAPYNWELGSASVAPLFDTCSAGGGGGTGGGDGYTGPAADAFPSSTLPSGAGTGAAIAVPTVGGMASTLGGMVGNFSAFTGLTNASQTVSFTLTLPGHSEPQTWQLASLPDTQTTMGAATEVFRLLLRGFLVCCLVYTFSKRIYRDLITY